MLIGERNDEAVELLVRELVTQGGEAGGVGGHGTPLHFGSRPAFPISVRPELAEGRITSAAGWGTCFDRLSTNGERCVCRFYHPDMADTRASCHAAAMILSPQGRA